MKKGITTVEQAVADELVFRNRQRGFRGNGSSGEVVPDWFVERKLEGGRKQVMPVVDSVSDDEAMAMLERHGSRDSRVLV